MFVFILKIDTKFPCVLITTFSSEKCVWIPIKQQQTLLVCKYYHKVG